MISKFVNFSRALFRSLIERGVYAFSLVRVSVRWPRRAAKVLPRGAPDVVVSLTSIPSRLSGLHIVIDGLLRQSLRPTRIVLWLDEKTKRSDLPLALTRLEGQGLTIESCVDVGPHTKYLYAMKHFPLACVVTADDDVMYHKHWLEELYDSWIDLPECVHCHRAHRIKCSDDGEVLPYMQWDLNVKEIGPSHLLFPTNCGGTLYPPGFGDELTLDADRFGELCPKADDVWLKAMGLLRRIRVVRVTRWRSDSMTIPGSQVVALWRDNVEEDLNDIQFGQIISVYNIQLS